MRKTRAYFGLFAATLAFFTALNLHAQVISYPPSGDNQKSIVTQYMGLVSVTIEYNSPNVTGPNGEDRSGKIWGDVVPFGMQNLGFGWSTDDNPSPWRVGANENTTIEFSHDVLVGGKPLSAGKYGLFMIPDKDSVWTIIFSRNYNSWGSYFYTTSEDELRIESQPVQKEFNEFLTFEFTERDLEHCKAQMRWENLAVPFEIAVPDFKAVYIERIENELRSEIGFYWQAWVTAASFCVNYNTHLEDGLKWADFAINGPFVGERNFQTLQTKASVLFALKRDDEAKELAIEAANFPGSNAFKVHQYGRSLMKEGKTEIALEVFKANHKAHKGAWPTNVGLARGYSALGSYKKAKKYAEKAFEQAPDKLNRENLSRMIKMLEDGKDVN
ncbi:MAG TPA: hypothetical protein DDX92_01415 [Flavobacteriales bacterium]|jgi:tetratricopeptide (TPR) repeat protein|nr:hypothetical protein [Flavobacteriales bacterium]